MNVYIYETITSGTSPSIIAAKQANNFQMFSQNNQTNSSSKPTFQIESTSASSGSIQITLDGTTFSDLLTFSTETSSSEVVVYEGGLQDFRVVVISNSGKVKVVAGI